MGLSVFKDTSRTAQRTILSTLGKERLLLCVIKVQYHRPFSLAYSFKKLPHLVFFTVIFPILIVLNIFFF